MEVLVATRDIAAPEREPARDSLADPASFDEFPAAHSMDSTWWAVDRDGHVALFSTGEAGAAPNNFYGGQDLPNEDALLALSGSIARLDLAGHRAHFGGDHVAPAYATNLVVFVRSPPAVADLELPPLQPATSGAATILHSTAPQLAELHARGACVACGHVWHFQREHANHGAYVYEHTTENWICGPYARLFVPERAAHIDQLPEVVADRAVRFDGRFSDRVEIQPAEHWECWGHGGVWLGLDRRTVRSLDPTDEPAWADRVAALRERFAGWNLVFAPDPDAT